MTAPLDAISPQWFEQVESGTEYVALIDAADRVVYVNHSHPLPAGDGASAPALVAVESRGRLRTAIDRARASGLPQRFDSRAAAPDGRVLDHTNWVVALSGPEGAGLVAFVAADVTQQGEIVGRLQLSETTLRSLIESSPDAILIVERDRRIVFVNRSEYGFDLADIIGQPVESFVPDGDRQTVIDAVERVLSTGEPYTYRSGFSSPAGQHHFSTRVVPIAGPDGVKRVMLVATDITTQLEADREKELLEAALQQAQRMESLGQLTGGVAHDFNNILVAISGNIELAQMCDDDPVRRSALTASALDAVRHAKVLTERLLAFSRKQTLRPQPVDVGALVDGMRELLTRSLGETIHVTVDFDPELLPCRVDPGQLESAVLNLAVNARDAMPMGGELRIRANNVVVTDGDGVSASPGEYVLLEVEDDGTGMPPEVAVQAIEPFFTTKAVGLGTGLGLSMVYGFVLQSGGHVRLLTEAGSGTTVQVYLPQTLQRPSETKAERRLDDVARGNEELILVVEDNEMVRSLTIELLEHLGYRAISADAADAAIEHLKGDAEISLMLTDLVLPGAVDGFALAQRARALRPGLRVLFVSGYPKDVLAGRGAEDVADDLLMKPFTTQQLADAVHRQTSERAADTA